MVVTVPDDLILAFFGETSTRLLGIDAKAAVASFTATDKRQNGPNSHFCLADCRRCVLDEQIVVLKDITERYREEQQQQQQQQQQHQQDGESSSSSGGGGVVVAITASQVQERLGRLQHEPNLSRELKVGMETMNDAARIAVCKLALYSEEDAQNNQTTASPSTATATSTSTSTFRNLQDEGRLDRIKMMEYFGLCQASLKLPCVMEFMIKNDRDSIFDFDGTNDKCSENKVSSSSSSAMMFPQARLEYVQRLLAKGIGWDPVFVTSELRKIFVEKPSDVDYDYYDKEVLAVFQKLVEQMTIVLRMATLQVRSKQDAELLNDLGKGGNTRVVSVQYSEFDVDQHGKKIESSTNSNNNAPEKERPMDEREERVSEEEKKRQLRLATEAAVLQQTILGELLGMDEEERNHKLKEAAEVGRKFMEEAMALPPGQERIEFLRGIDATTSRQLAMHKLWAGMLQANGGQPPKMVARK